MTEEQEPRVFAVVRGEVRSTGEKPPNTYFEGLVHLIKCYIGTGVYAMCIAIKYSGLILGPLMTILISLIDLHCQHMLVKCSVKVAMKEPDGERIFPTFDETVKYSFSGSPYRFFRKISKHMGTVTNVFLTMGQAGFCIAYFVFISTHFLKALEDSGWHPPYRVMLAIILVPMWLTTFLTSLRYLTPMNLFANILIWVGIAIVLYYTTNNMKHPSDLHFFNVFELPLFFGIVIFAFQNIGVILPLRSELANVNHYTSAFGILNMGMAFVVILYTAVGMVGYWKYGEDILGSVFLNFPKEDALTKAILIIICISVLFTFTLHFYILIEIIYPNFYLKWGPFERKYLVLTIFKTIAVLIIFGLANVSERIGLVISLVGSISGSYTSIILPALLEISLGGLSVPVLIKDILLILFGLTGALTGTVQSIMEIVKAIIGPEGNSTITTTSIPLNHTT